MMIKKSYLSAIAILLLTFGRTSSAAVRYASPSGAGSGTCTTWVSACTLNYAITQAISGDEVWVKQGTHPPLTLKNGVKVIGGFAGTETLASQSDPITRVTVIDGEGSARAVIGSDNPASAVLRGFTIKNGRGDGDGGGGIILQDSSALIVQCIFENNTDPDFGGAVAVQGSGSPQFINCTFRNNGERSGSNTKGGGAVFVYRGSPKFTNCLFHDNTANEGGAILVGYGTPTFINCTIADNLATVTRGGGLADQDGRATLRNCIVWGNKVTSVQPNDAQILNGAGGGSLATYSNVEGGWPGTANLDSNPGFVDAANANYRLQAGSPCVHAGENTALPPDAGNLDWDIDTDEVTPRDLALSIRKIGASVDMGAYELPPGGPPGGGGN